MQNERASEPTLESIAKRCLHVDTLETRDSDAQDFREYAIWQIRNALEAAFAAGVAAASAESKARSKKKRKVR